MMKPPLPYKRIVRVRTRRMRFSLRNTQSLHLMYNLLLQVVIGVAIQLSALWMARLFFHQLTRKLLDFSFSVLLCLSYTLSIFFCLCRYIPIPSVVMFSHGYGKRFSFVDEGLLTRVMFTSCGRGVICIFVQGMLTCGDKNGSTIIYMLMNFSVLL